MEQTYYVLLTKAGQDAYGRTVAGGPPVEFAQFAVGDGGGQEVTPAEAWTGLVNEVWRGAPILVEANPDNARIVTVEVYIPHNVGGFTVREVGLFDAKGVLLAVGNYPPSYKPTSESGAGKEMRARLLIEHSNAQQTTLKIDPSIVMASRDYAEKTAKAAVAEHDAADDAHGGMLLSALDALELHESATLTRGAHGFAPGADGTVLTSRAGATSWEEPFRPVIYELGEFYSFRHPILKPGFQPAQGGLLENAATLYPEAWAYLQTVEGQKLCKTEADWQAMTTAIWHTNADGTTVGWNGIGGAPFYAPNTATGALRLPDLRGMYAEASGYDGLGVGGVHGDAIRNFAGYAFNISGGHNIDPYASGIIRSFNVRVANAASGNGLKVVDLELNAGSDVPTANKNQPRAWGSLACVYLGQPAS